MASASKGILGVMTLALLLGSSCAATGKKPMAIADLPFAILDAEFSDQAKLCVIVTPMMKFNDPTLPKILCGETVGEFRHRLSHALSAN